MAAPTTAQTTTQTPVILAAKRTPIGKFFGGNAKVHAPHLAAFAAQAIFAENPALAAAAKGGQIDEVMLGNVLQAGLGQNPARQAALKAGLPDTTSAVTINKVCGSGLHAVMQAAASIKAGDNSLVLAGGFENMTGAPHFARVRDGVKFGPTPMEDHMAYDGLRCAMECWGMTNAADYIAKKYEVTRAEQDRFSAQSHQRAAEAAKQGWFKAELATLSAEQIGDKRYNNGQGLSVDEGVRAESTADTLGKLRTVPGHETITAGNSSQISDGGAAIVVASMHKAEQLGVKPIARIIAYHTSGVAPKEIFYAPVTGIQGVLAKANLTVKDIDLFEINEAFAAQLLSNIKPLGVDEKRLNICGGGIALGHPIGASGARVLTTLIHQLHRTGGKRGLAALCLGGGNSVAMIIEV